MFESERTITPKINMFTCFNMIEGHEVINSY